MERAQAQEIVYREDLWQPASGYNSLPTTSGQKSYSHHGHSRTMLTFELVVPTMSSATSEEQVRAALFDLEGVVDVVIDSYNQRVVVTGYVDPTQALMQVRRVSRNAAMSSEPSMSSSGNSYEDDGYVYHHAERTDNRTFTREPSKRGYVTTSSGDSSQYFTTKCPGYTTSVSNCYTIPNPDNNVERVGIFMS
jgi:hypothetical protein